MEGERSLRQQRAVRARARGGDRGGARPRRHEAEAVRKRARRQELTEAVRRAKASHEGFVADAVAAAEARAAERQSALFALGS